MSDIPQGWTRTSLSEIGKWSSGGTPSRTNAAYFGKGIPWVKSGDLPDGAITRTEEQITELGLNNSSAKVMPAGTISLALYGATIGKLGVMTFPAATNQACANVVPDTRLIEPQYLYFYLLSEREALIEKGQGGAQPNISQQIVKAHDILLAPLNEQRRIVAKLEKLLSRVDAVQERLAIIPRILKRFRQSVLAAACSGKLTVDWRDGRGQETRNGVPSAWSSTTLGTIADIVDPNPSHRYPSYEEGSVPILSTQEFSGLNDWDPSTAKLVPSSFFDERNRANGFFEDDIVFARKGRLGLARRPPKIPRYTFSHTIFLVRAKENVISEFLLWYLRQETCVTWLLNEMNSNTGVPTLGKAFLSQLPVAVPPTEEQQEIVRRVEALFKTADALEARYRTAKAHVDKLMQSILAKAFRGELVPQDPNDEPASLLLARMEHQKTGKGALQKERRK